MAQEIKNTFLKSKMNKDLDDRLLPNGEYKDARNISVGRSEDSDVGALENVIGNNLVTGTDVGEGLTIIGIKEDNATDSIFVFLTDYTDPSPANPTNAPASSKHYIYVYNSQSSQYTRLVQGEFLNFSTTNRIIGINLLENLLFWTDNRNQPRKINIISAVSSVISTGLESSYYTQEHQISIAKYNPYQAIELYNRADLQVLLGATSNAFQIDGHRKDELIGFIGAAVVCSETAPATQGTNYVKVISIVNSFTGPNKTTITVSPSMQAAPAQNDFVSLINSTMSNKNNDNSWPGDPDFLEDKFVRFSYRFKFDDNEYSIMAPFTQIAYIPKQNGFFVYGDEDSAYRSTVVDFMENQVQNIGLVIPLPTSANRLIRDYKITELEILFRESDGIAAKILTTISSGTILGESGVNNTYTYEYQSRKPYRTLPEAQTVRVYDKVPVRAFSQEIAGNRVIYGNYIDKHTPPTNVDYNCRIEKKSSTGAFNNWIEYPNHSVKRNRNYQVGFVLADKFGRKSPVLLSAVDAGIEENGLFYAGSTIYSPYDTESTNTSVLAWFGDVIQVLVNQPIESEINLAAGTPGLYAIKNKYSPNTGEGFAIASWGGTNITNTTYTFRQAGGSPNNQNIPRIGDSMRGAYTDFVKVTGISGPTGPAQYTVTTNGRVNDIYLRSTDSTVPDLKFTYTINDLGWYSYQIVVKQTEQDYYNVYLPGILNGYPGQATVGIANGPFPNDELNLTAHTILFNDNINKIPRDLSEVGEQDKQFRSSVELYGRVTNIMNSTTGNAATDVSPSNKQYYPRLGYTGKNAIKHTATTIATAAELDMSFVELSNNAPPASQAADGNLTFYQIDSNPLIARIATNEKSIGASAELIANPTLNASTSLYEWNMRPYLAIYETAPVESLLDIYWETSSEGLIVDLNAAIASGNTGVTGFQNITWDFKEDISPNTPVTEFFTPIDNQGLPFNTRTRGQLISITNGLDSPSESFELEEGAVGSSNEGKFRINYIGTGIVFVQGSNILDVYSFLIECTTNDGNGIVTEIPLQGVPGGFGALLNLQPEFAQIADIVKTPTDRILISAATWEATNFFNGSSVPFQSDSTGLTKRSQLRFSFVEHTGSTSIPSNWEMNFITGELTQRHNLGGPDNFTGNPLGIYKIKVTLVDANGDETSPTNANGYTPLSKQQIINIRLDPSKVNVTALSENCVLYPPPITGAPTVTADGVFGQFEPKKNVACVFYLSDNNLNPDGISDGSAFFNNKGMGIAPSNSNNFYYRIGSKNHKSGTLSFAVNTLSPYNGNGPSLLPNSLNVFKPPITSYFYRQPTTENPSPQWQALFRSAESNQVGHNDYGPTSAQIAAPGKNDDKKNDSPYPEANFKLEVIPSTFPPTYDTFTAVDRAISDRGPDPVWVQAVRAFDFDGLYLPQFEANSGPNGIEYAILCAAQVQFTPNNRFNNIVRSWVTADDLNYPQCVPWQGVNAVTVNGAGNLFNYKRSSGNSDSLAYANISINTWARSPYGDYVNELYTDATSYIAFIPNAGDEYINTSINRTIGGVANAIASWTDLPFTNSNGDGQGPDAVNEPLQFVTGFNGGNLGNGKKILNTTDNAGVGAKRVKPGESAIIDSGTLRISKN